MMLTAPMTRKTAARRPSDVGVRRRYACMERDPTIGRSKLALHLGADAAILGGAARTRVTQVPTKRTILTELTRDELRARLDHYELGVEDRRVSAQLVDALVRSRRAYLDDILQTLSLDRLKELCRAFDRDDSGRKKADLAARLMGRAAARPDTPKRRQRPVSAPPTPTPQPALSVRQPWAWALLYGGKTIENRTWPTRHRGRIWIHASERERDAAVVERNVAHRERDKARKAETAAIRERDATVVERDKTREVQGALVTEHRKRVEGLKDGQARFQAEASVATKRYRQSLDALRSVAQERNKLHDRVEDLERENEELRRAAALAREAVGDDDGGVPGTPGDGAGSGGRTPAEMHEHLGNPLTVDAGKDVGAERPAKNTLSGRGKSGRGHGRGGGVRRGGGG